jgi:acyl dehydratase
VLRPGGALHIVEWGPPVAFWVRSGFWLLQAVGGFVTTRDLAAGKLPGYLREAGFVGGAVNRYGVRDVVPVRVPGVGRSRTTKTSVASSPKRLKPLPSPETPVNPRSKWGLIRVEQEKGRLT